MKKIIYIFIFLISFLISIIYLFSLKNEIKNYPPSFEKEIVLIYIGSSTCSYCKDENVKKKINAIDDDLSGLLHSKNIGFKKIGISIDLNITDGYKHG